MSQVVILSGAGISAESGISTFRANDGLWEKHKIEEICQAGCLEYNYENTIAFYDARRNELQHATPNHAHKKVALLKESYPDKIAVITQNIDNLFERAGCKEVIHLHGYLPQLRCMECEQLLTVEYAKQNENHFTCQACHSHRLRPHVVFFGESAPMYTTLYQELNDCSLFISIGTSGAVLDVSTFAGWSDYSILNNLEPNNAINDSFFDKVLYKKATDAIDEIAVIIEEYLK